MDPWNEPISFDEEGSPTDALSQAEKDKDKPVLIQLNNDGTVEPLDENGVSKVNPNKPRPEMTQGPSDGWKVKDANAFEKKKSSTASNASGGNFIDWAAVGQQYMGKKAQNAAVKKAQKAADFISLYGASAQKVAQAYEQSMQASLAALKAGFGQTTKALSGAAEAVTALQAVLDDPFGDATTVGTLVGTNQGGKVLLPKLDLNGKHYSCLLVFEGSVLGQIVKVQNEFLPKENTDLTTFWLGSNPSPKGPGLTALGNGKVWKLYAVPLSPPASVSTKKAPAVNGATPPNKKLELVVFENGVEVNKGPISYMEMDTKGITTQTFQDTPHTYQVVEQGEYQYNFELADGTSYSLLVPVHSAEAAHFKLIDVTNKVKPMEDEVLDKLLTEVDEITDGPKPEHKAKPPASSSKFSLPEWTSFGNVKLPDFQDTLKWDSISPEPIFPGAGKTSWTTDVTFSDNSAEQLKKILFGKSDPIKPAAPPAENEPW